MKIPVYLKTEDADFENLEENLDIYKVPPTEGAEPCGFVIKLSGNAEKNQRKTCISVLHKSFLLIQKYRLLKDLVFNKTLGNFYFRFYFFH